jgi:hypothetical protein
MGLLYRRCFLLFLLLTIVEQSRADFYYFLQHSNKSAYRINSLSRNLEKLQKEGSWGVIKAVKFDSLTLLGLPKNIIISQIPSLDSSKVYFIANCTNQFYLFDLKTMLFKRVDKTFYRGDNCHAYHFFRKGVLHSVGGYGFWRTNNHIIYFDEKSKEWEAYSSNGTPPFGIYGGFIAYLPERDELISFMNYTHDVNINNGAFFRDRSIYIYSFKKGIWTKTGMVYSKEFLEIFDKTAILPHFTNYFTGKYFIIPAIPFSGFNQYYAIDARTLELFLFKDVMNRLSKFQIEPSGGPRNVVVGNHDLLMNIRPIQSEKDVFEDSQLENMDGLFVNAKPLGFIQDEIWYKTNLFFGILFTVFFSLILALLRKKGKLFFMGLFSGTSPVKYSNKFASDATIQLLKRLVETYESGGIDVSETNSILGLSSLGHDAQRYKRSAIVKEANVKLALLTNCLDTIQRLDSSVDRRQKRYVINSIAIHSIKDYLKS